MVDVAYFDEIIRVENVKASSDLEDSNLSNAYQLSMSKLIEDLDKRHSKAKPSDISIRDHYSNAYNPRRNEGFFASKILLVEGMTEEYSLPIYADKILGRSFDSLGVSVVECGSKCSIDRLYRIFNELHIPCYIIMDYDHGNSDSNIIKISKDLLKLAGENEDYHPTLFVSDRIAYFPKTIEEYLRTILRDYDKLVEEARRELGVKKDGSKPLIGRFIARKMCSAGAPPIPEEFSNLIKKAVSVEWTSSCLSASTVD
jgi:putative ATP-dependent endonuclease of OLD family